MRGTAAHLRQHLPAALAFRARRHRRPRAGHRRRLHRGTGHDQDIRPGLGRKQPGLFIRQRHHHRGLGAGTDALIRPHRLQLRGSQPAQLTHRLPLRAKRIVAPAGRDGREVVQMDAVRLAEPRRPRLLGGEHQHRRQPGAQAAMQVVQHRARRPAPQRVRPVAVQRVLADIEVEGAEIGRAEIVHGGIHAGPVVALHGRAHHRVQLRHPVQHPALQLRHVGLGHALRLAEPIQGAQQPAQRVAQPAIQLGLLLQDLLADPHVLAGVGGHHPQPQDIGAVLVVHLLGGHHIAERLAHLAALLVHHEAMRQHRLERRHPARAHGLQQRGMEPAAMLVRTLQIQIGRPGQPALFQHEGMGRTALEPHIHDVEHLLVIGRVAPLAQEPLGRGRVPRIRPLGFECGDNPVHHRLLAQHLAAGLLHEHRDRHAPGALPADAPIRAGGHHGADPVAPHVRHEPRCRDRLQRLAANILRPVHADEPLRRRAEDQRRLGTPGMRVGMHQLAARHQPAGLGQRRAHRIGHLVNVLAREARHPGIVGAVLAHRLRHLDAVLAAELEILLAVARRDVHEPGAGIRRHVFGRIHRHVMVIAAPAHRVRAHRAQQLAPLVHMQHMVRLHPRRLAELRQQGEGHQHPLPGLGQRALLGAVDPHHGVVDVLAQRDRPVARHGPGRGGPDQDRRAVQPRHRPAHDREPHCHRRAGMVVVLDLGLGQRRLLHRRPHHGAEPAIQRPVHQEAPDLAEDRRLARQIHGGIALRPVAQHAQPAELALLHAHPMLGIGAALGAEFQQRHRVLVLLGGAILLLDLPFDRQPVAVPARDVVGVIAAHLPGAVHHVLQDLVQRRADMQVAVRIRGAVMQDEARPALLGAQLAPDIHLLPPGQHPRLLLRQVAAHRERRVRQEHRAAIVAAGSRGGSIVGHGMCLARPEGAAKGVGNARVEPGSLARGRANNSRYDDPKHATIMPSGPSIGKASGGGKGKRSQRARRATEGHGEDKCLRAAISLCGLCGPPCSLCPLRFLRLRYPSNARACAASAAICAFSASSPGNFCSPRR